MKINEIIKIASNTNNVGLTNNYTFKASKKNSLCGDTIKIELLVKKTKIHTMKYETESCIYCEASASLLSKKIKNLSIKNIKKKINTLRKNQFPNNFKEFKSLIGQNNSSRTNCVFLPFEAVLKALGK